MCEAAPASLCNASAAFFQPALPPPARAKVLSGQARGYLDRGLLLESERLYLAAVAALLALWLTRRSLASFTATMRFRVGLQTLELGSLYHELAG